MASKINVKACYGATSLWNRISSIRSQIQEESGSGDACEGAYERPAKDVGRGHANNQATDLVDPHKRVFQSLGRHNMECHVEWNGHIEDMRVDIIWK